MYRDRQIEMQRDVSGEIKSYRQTDRQIDREHIEIDRLRCRETSEEK